MQAADCGVNGGVDGGGDGQQAVYGVNCVNTQQTDYGDEGDS